MTTGRRQSPLVIGGHPIVVGDMVHAAEEMRCVPGVVLAITDEKAGAARIQLATGGAPVVMVESAGRTAGTWHWPDPNDALCQGLEASESAAGA